jgi:hypothetical protein
MRTRIEKNTDRSWTAALDEAKRRGLHIRDDDDDLEAEHPDASDDLLQARGRRERLQKQGGHAEKVAEAMAEERAAEDAYRRTLPGYHSEALAREDEDQGGGEVSKALEGALEGLYTNAVEYVVRKSQDHEEVEAVRDRRRRLGVRHLAKSASAYADPEAAARIEAIRKAELGIRWLTSCARSFVCAERLQASRTIAEEKRDVLGSCMAARPEFNLQHCSCALVWPCLHGQRRARDAGPRPCGVAGGVAHASSGVGVSGMSRRRPERFHTFDREVANGSAGARHRTNRCQARALGEHGLGHERHRTTRSRL